MEKVNSYFTTKESTLNIERVDVKDIFETIRAEFAEQLAFRSIALAVLDAPAEVNVD